METKVKGRWRKFKCKNAYKGFLEVIVLILGQLDSYLGLFDSLIIEIR